MIAFVSYQHQYKGGRKLCRKFIRNPMNFRQIEAFRTVMRCGTVTRAAETLCVSQPAVSRHLQELERATGLTLFERGRGRISPTAEGHAFYEEVCRVFDGLDRLRYAANEIRGLAAAQLRIASLPALGHAFLPRVIGAFAAEHPTLRVLLSVRSSEFVKQEVAAGSFDLGFAADEITRAGVQVRPFSSPDAVCLLPREHPLSARPVLEPADLHGQRMVALFTEDAARLQIDRILAASGAVPQIVCETQYSLTCCHLVRTGIGLALVNPFALDGLDLSGVALVPFRPSARFSSLLVLPPGAPRSRLVEDFLALARKERDRLLSAVG